MAACLLIACTAQVTPRTAGHGGVALVSNGGAPAAGPSNDASAIARLGIQAPTAILIDARTDRILYAKHPDERRPIASIAKIMTALLVLERAGLGDVAGVTWRAAKAPPIRLGLQRKQRVAVRDLLWGLLLWSGNDASVALAEHVSGSVSRFVRLMNARGQALGLHDTYFASPSGLDDRGYSTVRDVATLTRGALRNPTFARIVATRRHFIPGPAAQIHRLRNLNALLGSYSGAVGVKTGYTEAAGNCIVAAAERGHRLLIAVVLGDPAGTQWRAAYADVRRLLDYGFALEPPSLAWLGLVGSPVSSPLPA